MNKEHTEFLIKNYPKLYRDYTASPQESLMCFGFECGDGWFELIRELSERLELLGAVALQVKEKFGTLRFYYYGPIEADTLVDDAEMLSGKICEDCGEPGELSVNGRWLKTLCASCRKESGYAEAEKECEED